MRAIIIDDKDAKELVRQLDHQRIKASGNVTPISGNPIDDAHRIYHYVIVNWLQEQGCKVT